MRAKTITTALAALSLSACMARPTTAPQKSICKRQIPQQCSTSLFRLNDLRDVDLSPKEVLVYVNSTADDCDESRSLGIMKHVTNFYAQLNINLRVVYTERIPSDSLTYNRVGLMFVDNVQGGSGEAQMEKRMCYVETWSESASVFIHLIPIVPYCDRNLGTPELISAGIAAHEIGHLFYLWHSERFAKDCVDDYVQPNLPNFMSHSLPPDFCRAPIGFGFNTFQQRQIHSYLSQGIVYRQVSESNTLEEYLNKVGIANGWQRRR